MHRFYIAPEDWNPDGLVLRGGEVHHASNVLRLVPGSRVMVFDGRGREGTAEIIRKNREEIWLRRLQETRVAPLRCRITLAQALPKGKSMDSIVHKAVEIGAAEIAPIISKRTVVRLSESDARQKQDKGTQGVLEAEKQCG